MPAKPTTCGAKADRTVQNYTPFHDNAVYFDNDLQKEKYRREQEELLKRRKEEEDRRRRQEEQEASRRRQEEYEQRKQKEEQESKERKRRENIQAVKNSVINWYVTCHIIPNEIKANALIVIERVLEKLPISELPMSELIQIAEGIRDKVYAPYLKTLEVEKSEKKEVGEMAKTKIYSGIFYCPDCDAEFELDQADETELVCNDCGTRLEETDDED